MDIKNKNELKRRINDLKLQLRITWELKEKMRMWRHRSLPKQGITGFLMAAIRWTERRTLIQFIERSISNEYRKEQKRGNHKESQGKPG